MVSLRVPRCSSVLRSLCEEGITVLAAVVLLVALEEVNELVLVLDVELLQHSLHLGVFPNLVVFEEFPVLFLQLCKSRVVVVGAESSAL